MQTDVPLTQGFSSLQLRRNAPLLVVYGMILVLVIIGTSNSSNFLTDRNIFNVLRTATFLGTVALGQMFVILTGGIDLSVGSLVKLSVLTSSALINGDSANTWPGVLAALGLGVLVGFIHALIITRTNVAPFIVTLGSYSILRGIALAISTGPIGRASSEIVKLYDLRIVSVPVLVIGFAVLLVVAVFVLRRTTFGRYVYAVGGSEQVARLAGIPINR